MNRYPFLLCLMQKDGACARAVRLGYRQKSVDISWAKC